MRVRQRSDLPLRVCFHLAMVEHRSLSHSTFVGLLGMWYQAPFSGTVLNLLLRPPALALDCGGPLDIVVHTHREHVHCGGIETSRQIVAIMLT